MLFGVEHLEQILAGLIAGPILIMFGLWRKKEFHNGSTDHYDKATRIEEKKMIYLPLIMGPVFIIIGLWNLVALIMDLIKK